MITQPELAVTLETGVPPCSCGSMKIQPTNLRWYHWLLPRVLKFAYQRLRGLA